MAILGGFSDLELVIRNMLQEVSGLNFLRSPKIFSARRNEDLSPYPLERLFSHSLTLKTQGRHEATGIFESFPYVLLGFITRHVHLSTAFLWTTHLINRG